MDSDGGKRSTSTPLIVFRGLRDMYVNRICAGQSVANSLGSDSGFPLSHLHSTFHLEDVACHRINTGNLIAKAKDKVGKDIEIDDLYTET